MNVELFKSTKTLDAQYIIPIKYVDNLEVNPRLAKVKKYETRLYKKVSLDFLLHLSCPFIAGRQ